MNKKELVDALEQGIAMLKLNKETIDITQINELHAGLAKLLEPDTKLLLETMLGEGFSTNIETIVKLLDSERKLLEPNPKTRRSTTDNLIDSLTRLKGRPLVLSMICTVI